MHFGSLSNSKHDPTFITSVKCRIVDNLPLGWCLDDNHVPRYLGKVIIANTSITAETAFDVLHYTHAGFEKCLAKKTVVFIGESRTRYQFMHLSSFLKSEKFMKCPDRAAYDPTVNSRGDDECLAINEQAAPDLIWNSWYKTTSHMLRSNISNQSTSSAVRIQDALCDCFREDGSNKKNWYENRYVKRHTPYGEINLIHLQNFANEIRMGEDFPPFKPFYLNASLHRCMPGECGRYGKGDSKNYWEGNLNDTLWNIVPALKATHVYANPGWSWRTDVSCLFEAFNNQHPGIIANYLSHPANGEGVLDPTQKMECDVDIHILDRTTISSNVPGTWYWDRAHVLSILNEEFNHQMIKKICPMDRL